ncbi:putative 28S rRNA (cytosine-C(5))-methyltransferase, partial [Cladochytrium tenue]
MARSSESRLAMLYHEAAKVLDRLDRGEGSIKGLVFASHDHTPRRGGPTKHTSSRSGDADRKRLFALVCEALKYKEVLRSIIDASGLGSAKPKLQPNLALVLVYDFLLGPGLSGAGQYKALLLRHKARLHAELARIKVRRKVSKNEDLIPDHIRNAASDEGDDENEEATAAEDRVKALADFQVSALLHAFRFPSVRRVVYSTCSRHREENEDVVARALAAQDRFRLCGDVLPAWHRRGMPVVDGHEHLIRTDPDEDLVIGFFVALFECDE